MEWEMIMKVFIVIAVLSVASVSAYAQQNGMQPDQSAPSNMNNMQVMPQADTRTADASYGMNTMGTNQSGMNQYQLTPEQKALYRGQ
jgi:Tfp pilus assembly protein PilV